LRIKEQGTHLTLHEHHDDDDIASVILLMLYCLCYIAYVILLMLYCSINEKHGNGNAAYYGRLCDIVLCTTLSSLRMFSEGTVSTLFSEGTVSTLAGICIEVQSTHVNTFLGVAGLTAGTAACFVPADSGKMVGNCDTYVACPKYCQKKKSGVVK